MTPMTIKFTAKELELLTSLAADQLFRREFIDNRLPGWKTNPDDIGLGKELVERMRTVLDPRSARRTHLARIAG